MSEVPPPERKPKQCSHGHRTRVVGWLPEFITFTGLDERTDLARAWYLSGRYPVEFGVLFSRTRAGRDPRYPSNDVLSDILSYPFPLLSAHICGSFADDIMRGDSPHFGCDLGCFRRVQVNHRQPSALAIRVFAKGWGLRGIGQTRIEFPRDTQIDWLFDRSGGRGEPPTSWPHQPVNRMVGYAGGVNPDNAASFVATRTGRYWIDMESGVRTDNWLDLDKCEAVCRAVFKEASRG